MINLKTATLVALIGSGIRICLDLHSLMATWGYCMRWLWPAATIADVAIFIFFLALFQLQNKRK